MKLHKNVEISLNVGDGDELQWESVDEDSCSSWIGAKPEKPKIKRDPAGKVIFDADLYGCMFTEDTVVASIEAMVGESGVLDIPFLQIFILRQTESVRHELCQQLFNLMSLTQDTELLFALRKCTPLCHLGWRPSFTDLLTAFFNWGAPIPLLCERMYKISWPSDSISTDSNPRITTDNIKLVLHHMESGLPYAMKAGEAAIDVLFKSFCLLSMEKIFVSTFTRRFLLHCLSSLVDHIPDSMWTQDKVWHLSELAIAGVEDHIHDLSLLCKKMLTLSSRCENISVHLAYQIICRCNETVEHKIEVDLPELPITVSHIVQLCVTNCHFAKEMDLHCVDVMLDMLYTVIVKNDVSKDVVQVVVKYLDYMLNAIRENYKSHDVTAVRKKVHRFINILKV